MTRFRLFEWPNARKPVTLIDKLRMHARISLSEAYACLNRVVEGSEVTLTLADDQTIAFTEALGELGVKFDVEVRN